MHGDARWLPARRGSHRGMARLRNAGAGRRVRRHVGLGQHRLPQARRHLPRTATTSSSSPATRGTRRGRGRPRSAREENAAAWGGGWGRTVENARTATPTSVYFLVFSDSHRKPEYNLGYAWNTYWGPRSGIQAGLGYTAFIIARGGHRQRLAVSRGAAAALGALRPGDAVQRRTSRTSAAASTTAASLRLRQGRARLRRSRMNVLVIGGGGREHALAWKLAQSPRVAKVFVAPGNAGHRARARARQRRADRDPGPRRVRAASTSALTVVGPEAPLAAGVVDAFRAAGLPIFGPTQAAAQLESSKDYAKAFMARHGIPTARYATFTDAAAAHAYVDAEGAPIVVKADGLAAGKGVVVAATAAEAHAAIDAMLDRQRDGRGRRARRDRGVPRGRGGELHRHGRRPQRAAARVVAGSQAPADRRRGPEHRRHGRVFAGAGGHARRCTRGSCARSSCRPCTAWRPTASRTPASCTRG